MPVVTFLPRHVTSTGNPTFSETIFISAAPVDLSQLAGCAPEGALERGDEGAQAGVASIQARIRYRAALGQDPDGGQHPRFLLPPAEADSGVAAEDALHRSPARAVASCQLIETLLTGWIGEH